MKCAKPCLDQISYDPIPQNTNPVPAELMRGNPLSGSTLGLEVSCNNVCIRVTNETSPELLKMVLPMLNDATCFKNVFIVTGYTDLRSGIDTLISIVEANHLSQIPFIFCGRRTDRMYYGEPIYQCWSDADLAFVLLLRGNNRVSIILVSVLVQMW